jgi:hypothetical protein
MSEEIKEQVDGVCRNPFDAFAFTLRTMANKGGTVDLRYGRAT